MMAVIMMIAFTPSAVNVDAQASSGTVTDNIELTITDKNGDLVPLEGAQITVSSGGRVLDSGMMTGADGIADYRRAYRDDLDYTIVLPKADYDFVDKDKYTVFKGSSEYHRWRLVRPHYLPTSLDWKIRNYKLIEEDGLYKISFSVNNAPLAWGKTFIKINLEEYRYYRVSFDVNGGDEEVAEQVVKRGGMAVEPPLPTREGYDFVGWQVDGSKYYFGRKVWEDLHLKATWEKIAPPPNKYTVSFDVNGGNGEIASQIVEEGRRAYSPTRPKREGYKFVQWELDGQKYHFYEYVTSDIVLVAKWEKLLPKYRVSFDVNGGSSSVYSQMIEEGKKARKPSNPYRHGYDFVEWQLDGERFDFDSAITEDITLKAIWKKVEEPEPKKYTVKFDVNGGNEEIPDQIVEEKHSPVEPPEPKRDGYEFVEWQLDGEEYSFWYVTRDITLVAIWEEVSAEEAIYSINMTKTVDEAEKILEDGEVKFDFTVEIENTGTRNLISVVVYDEILSFDGERVDLDAYESSDSNIRFLKDSATKEVLVATKVKEPLKPGQTKTFKYSVRLKNIGDYLNDAYGRAYYRNKYGIDNGHGAVERYLKIESNIVSTKLRVRELELRSSP